MDLSKAITSVEAEIDAIQQMNTAVENQASSIRSIRRHFCHALLPRSEFGIANEVEKAFWCKDIATVGSWTLLSTFRELDVVSRDQLVETRHIINQAIFNDQEEWRASERLASGRGPLGSECDTLDGVSHHRFVKPHRSSLSNLNPVTS